MSRTRTVIFGGSFDPVHNGHVGIVKKALAELSPDRLFVVPAAVSPFKTSSSPKLGDDIRLECLKAAFGGADKVTVDDRELKKGGVSFAVDTVGVPPCRDYIALYGDSFAPTGNAVSGSA